MTDVTTGIEDILRDAARPVAGSGVAVDVMLR